MRQQAHGPPALVRELDIVKGDYLDTGFTFSQCHVLFELSLHKSLNLMELAENLSIDKSNTSRTVKKLVELGLVKAEKVASDNRQKLFSLTSKGEKALRSTISLANKQVESVLATLSEEEQELVIQGIRLYANALRKSRLQSTYKVRMIQKCDNPHVARLIRKVMTEFDAVGEGYSIDDSEIDDMYGHRQTMGCHRPISCQDPLAVIVNNGTRFFVPHGVQYEQSVFFRCHSDPCDCRRFFAFLSTRHSTLRPKR